MLQKELAKRLKARYDTKMDGNEWLEVSSDGIPLCRIKYNGQFLSNADQNLSDEYRSKIADIQDEISTVREYVGLYEHAPQMKADGVSDYRQLAAFGDSGLSPPSYYACRAHKNKAPLLPETGFVSDLKGLRTPVLNPLSVICTLLRSRAESPI